MEILKQDPAQKQAMYSRIDSMASARTGINSVHTPTSRRLAAEGAYQKAYSAQAKISGASRAYLREHMTSSEKAHAQASRFAAAKERSSSEERAGANSGFLRDLRNR